MMSYIKRKLCANMLDALRASPVVYLNGPRQGVKVRLYTIWHRGIFLRIM